MSSTPSITETVRNKPKLCHDGHMYVYDRPSADNKLEFWRCQFRGKCKSRLHRTIETGEVVKLTSVHSHPPDAAYLEIASLRNSLKRRAADTQEAPSQLINSMQAGVSSAVQLEFPSNNALKKIVGRVRKTTTSAPAVPTDRSSVVIPESYATYESEPGESEPFLLGDSGVGDQSRILIFGCSSTSEWIAYIEKVYVDGTFSLAPKIFEQVFVILGERSGFVIPVCYALLPDKSQATYTRMLQLLLQTWPHFRPNRISLDFEIGLVNAFRSLFPSAEFDGCLFHLVKNMKKKLSELGLFKKYKRNPDFALSARMIPAMAFVRPEDIEMAISVLAPTLPEDLIAVLNYFEDTYVGRLRLAPNGEAQRGTARFPIEMWSVYQRTLDGGARTNNFAEAAHRRLQGEFGVDHPSLWKFIDGLREVQHNRDCIYSRYVAGHPPEKKRNKYVQADKRILEIVTDYPNRAMIDYLRGLARNFQMRDSAESSNSNEPEASEDD